MADSAQLSVQKIQKIDARLIRRRLRIVSGRKRFPNKVAVSSCTFSVKQKQDAVWSWGTLN